MKKIFILLISIIATTAAIGQVVPLRGDTIKIYKQGGAAELVLKNSTKDSTGGFLFNVADGRTIFKRALIKINDSTYLVGLDTLKIKSSGIGGGAGDGIVELGDGWGLVKVNDSTYRVDTTLINSKWQSEKTRDSLAALIALKLNLSDTATMLTPYLRTAGDLPILFTTTESAHDINFAPANTTQFKILGRKDAGSGAYSFLDADSSLIAALHSELYYNTKYYSITNPGGYISNITGLITNGTNVTLPGAGTSGNPYIINATNIGTHDLTLTGNRVLTGAGFDFKIDGADSVTILADTVSVNNELYIYTVGVASTLQTAAANHLALTAGTFVDITPGLFAQNGKVRFEGDGTGRNRMNFYNAGATSSLMVGEKTVESYVEATNLSTGYRLALYGPARTRAVNVYSDKITMFGLETSTSDDDSVFVGSYIAPTGEQVFKMRAQRDINRADTSVLFGDTTSGFSRVLKKISEDTSIVKSLQILFNSTPVVPDTTNNTISWNIIASGSGEVNTASNLGGGLANWDSKSGVDLRFNSFAAADFDLASNLITIDATKWLTISAGNAAYQPLDADLTTIAGLTATTDNFIQSKAGAWASRTIAQVKTDLGLTGTNSGDQTITLTSDVTGSGTGSFATTIANDVVSYAKMQNISATSRIMGRITAGAGDMEELTGAQATTLLDLFSTTTTTKGLVPGSNNVGSTFFLDATGAWSVPPGGGSYTDENAQDAIGAMINASLQYVDGTPLLAIGDRDYTDITITGSGLTMTVDNGAVLLNEIGAASGNVTRDHDDNLIVWQWNNNAAGGSNLSLTANTTTAVDGDNLLLIQPTGTHASSNVTTYAGNIFNTHDGTNSTNVGLRIGVNSGTFNYALQVVTGNVGILDETPLSPLTVGASDAFQVANAGFITITEQTAPGTPASGRVAIYPKADGLWYGKDDAGLETQISNAGGGGYTNLTQFVDQTAWRVFYSNTSGDVVELALGADNTVLSSNGAAAAPTFEAMQVINLTSPLSGDILIYDAANSEFDNARGTAYNVTATKTTTATLTTSEETIFANGSETAFTITLPAASGNTGKRYNIICTGTQGATVTIDGNASETINTLLNVTLEQYGTRWELICDGSNWIAQFYNSTGPDKNVINISDEFFAGAEIGEVGALGWNIVGTGTEVFPQIDGVSGHAGIVSLGTGIVSGDDCDMFLGGTATSGALNPLLPDNDFDATWIVRIGTITTMSTQIGLAQVALDGSYATNHFAGFLFNPATSAKWRMRTRAGADTDNTSTGADVAAGTWYKLRILKTGTTFRFYINDVFQFAHTTNQPTNALSPYCGVNTITTATRTLDVDYFNLRTNIVR